ncbi:cell wall/surface repeat protein [Clostridium sp. DL-VIII]|uniref:Ig-like domain-containing protein n=1 Tax=Clostridium sp. DL-VIII TaxID=641107 RepID=UPI00023B06C6|nr:Ig-like domain-containing protein [Clostridium sp. DL-VIII]EHJ02096.1 cell wall/surface repeat protein [Clostridium sp. DL-VIII]
MKRKLINKIVAGAVISTTLCTLNPVKASAEWVNDYQGNFYYMQGSQRLTGWNRIDGQLYYFDEDGKMQTGWIKAGSSWYYLQNSGALKTGWINYNKNWYYADSNGAMQSGVINISGKVYIFDNNGILQTRNIVINGEFYTIGSDGEVVGARVPTPSKEFDGYGNYVQILKSDDAKANGSPTNSSFNNVIEDQTESDDDPNEGRIFKVLLKDSNGSDLNTKTVKYNKKIDLYEPTKTGYYFSGWNTKSDGSGKNYDEDDDIKVKEDLTLYAQWSQDNSTKVDSITIKGSSYVTINKTIQMTAEVLPSDAANRNVKWSVTNGTGQAKISSSGELTGVANGTVTVKAASTDGSNVIASKTVTVSATDILVPVSKITVTSTTGMSQITTDGGTLQMVASVLPSDADNQDVTWSVDETSGGAEISDTGLLTAKSNGTVTVKATAKDNSGVVGTKTITISGQNNTVPVESITSVTGSGGINAITTDASLGGANGTLQMVANILPTNASNKTVTWAIIPDSSCTGKASISTYTGLLTAEADGKVKVRATLQSNPQIYKEGFVDIRNQSVKLTGFVIHAKDQSGQEKTSIDSNAGTLEMSISTTPAAASYKSVAWSTERAGDSTGSANIVDNGNHTATLKAVTDGEVLVKAVVTALDGSKITQTTKISITGQNSAVSLTGIQVTDKSGSAKPTITADNGTLQMVANFLPYNQTEATASSIKWTAVNETGAANIDPNTGILTAVSNGKVNVIATYTPSGTTKPSISGNTEVYIQGQYNETTDITITPDGPVEVGGTLQMNAAVKSNGGNSTYTAVKWSVQGSVDGGSATIDNNGVLKGLQIGNVIVIATSDYFDGVSHGKSVSKTIYVSEKVPITGIDLSSNSSTLDCTNGNTLQMSATLTGKDGKNPTNPTINWSVTPAGTATITPNGGLLTAIANGSVTVTAATPDGTVTNTKVITIQNLIVNATGYTLKGFPVVNGTVGASETNKITDNAGTLQMKANVVPATATTIPTQVNWSAAPCIDGPSKSGGAADIVSNTDGALLTAKANGDVRVTFTAIYANGTKVSGSEVITITGQIVNVTGIAIDRTKIPSAVGLNKKLQMAAAITPAGATNRSINWKVTDNTGADIPSIAVIDPTGVLTTMGTASTVKVTATSADNPSISDYVFVTIG